MSHRIKPLDTMIYQLSKLPGIGPKSAQRLAYHILRLPAEQVRELATAIYNGKRAIRYCTACGDFTQEDPCSLCADEKRSNGIICVVADPRDVLAIERSNAFSGRYHVLHGTISPMDGIGPDDIRINELLARITPERITEIIMATNPDIEGEATATYIARLLQPLGVTVTRIAHGLPVGADLEYTDEVTISMAISGRREI